jgi:hypothetical protein
MFARPHHQLKLTPVAPVFGGGSIGWGEVTRFSNLNYADLA